MTSGICAITVLLGVYVNTYTDASSLELGFLLMLMPFTGILSRPIICSYADRNQAHQKCIMWCLFTVGVSYSPFLIVPFLGPEIYQVYTRTCWYILLVSKVIGDAALGGVISVGDSLAVNYAAKVGVDFSVYRIWGTISWMTFGFTIGQINEVSFLPKYVPAFTILVVTNLLDMLIIWLWPPEYFTMVRREKSRKKSTIKGTENKKGENSFTKSLLPKEVVWNHAKNKLLWLITLGFYDSSKRNITDYSDKNGKSKLKNLNISTVAIIGHKVNDKLSDKVNIEEGVVDIVQTKGDKTVSKTIQLKILGYLMKKDPRIILYIMFFICAGASLSPVSFLIIHLSNRCRDEGTCQVSQLAGMLQVSMASAETVLFIFIRKLKAMLGRLNLIAIGIGLLSIKYLYYETIYYDLDPYYTFFVEMLQGLAYGTFLQVSVEIAHIFALEVCHIIPELYETGVVSDEVDKKKLELSLCATMQALIACSQDGLGRGLGALTFGLFAELYGYDSMWIGITIGAGIVCVITFTINFLSYTLNLKYGLGMSEWEEEEEQNEDKQENNA